MKDKLTMQPRQGGQPFIASVSVDEFGTTILENCVKVDILKINRWRRQPTITIGFSVGASLSDVIEATEGDLLVATIRVKE